MAYGDKDIDYNTEETVIESPETIVQDLQKEVASSIVDEKVEALQKRVDNEQKFSEYKSTIDSLQSDLGFYKRGENKEGKKLVNECRTLMKQLEKVIRKNKRLDRRLNNGRSDIDPRSDEQMNVLFAKLDIYIGSIKEQLGQVVTGDIMGTKKAIAPNVIPDPSNIVSYGIEGGKQGNTTSTTDLYNGREICNTTPVLAKDTKEAFEKGGIVGAMDYRGAKSNMDPNMRAISRGAAFLGLAGLGIRGIKKLYGSFKEGGRRKTPAVLIGGSIGLNMASGMISGKPFGLTDIFKGFALGGNDLPKRLLSVGQITVDKAGKVISDIKNETSKSAMEIMQPSLISSYFLRDIPFSSLTQPIQTADGTTKNILGIENNIITGCNVDALQAYLNSNNNIDPKNKQERQKFIDEYSNKSDGDKTAIQKLFVSGLIGLGIISETIKNNPNNNLADNHYKPKLDELAKNAEQEQKKEEQERKEKINNSGESYNGKDDAKVTPYLTKIERDITDPTIKEHYTPDFQTRLEKKLNILYMQHPKSAPISISFDKNTNEIKLTSYGQTSSLDILSEKNIVSIPYSITNWTTSSLEETINIAQLTNLLTAPAPVGFAGASTLDEPFNRSRGISHNGVEQDIEFSKHTAREAIKDLNLKEGLDTAILNDTLRNNFDENFPSINHNKTGFINWLNGFKKNGKSLWKK